MTADRPERLGELTNRQRALYWFTLAEASSIDEQLMIVSVLARQIRASMPDVIAVREVLLSTVESER